MDHEIAQTLIPAHALGATDPEEAGQLDAHLRVCARCRALLADYQVLSDDLLYAIPPVAAPPELAHALRRRLRPVPGRPVRPRAWFTLPRALPIAALVASLVLLLLTNLYWLRRTDTLGHQTAMQATAIAVLAEAPTIVLRGDTPAPAARGQLYFRPESTMALLHVYELPPLPPDKAYQVWLIRDGHRDSGGLFRVDEGGEGVLLIVAPRPLQEYDAVGITAEPAGGSPGPTSPRVMGGRF